MQVNADSSFISYKLTKEEYISGVSFSSNQRAVMQNLIGDIAEELITVTYDPQNPAVFQQRNAELMGQLGILKHLMSLESQLIKED